MKITVITAVYNNKEYIRDAVDSVLSQDHLETEYIVVDGGSTDGTLEILRSYGDRITKLVSGPDNGVYDAMNKGLSLASGEVVGFLNADDFYPEKDILSSVAKKLEETKADSLWGDLLYVDPKDTNRTIRAWRSSSYVPGGFRNGWMPPHPTFFARRVMYQKFGHFRDDMKIAADYELMLRFLEKERISWVYLPKTMVRMRTGGLSNRNLKNVLRANLEAYRAWSVNGLRISPWRMLLKPFSKINQYFKK